MCWSWQFIDFKETNVSLLDGNTTVIKIFVMCLCLGFAIGSKILAGYLIGLIVSGMQLGISGTNSGGSW